MKIYYDEDANLEIIKNLKVTIVGYGSQGHCLLYTSDAADE